MESFYVLEKMAEWKMKEMEQFYCYTSLQGKKDGAMFRLLQGFKVKKPTATSCCCYK